MTQPCGADGPGEGSQRSERPERADDQTQAGGARDSGARDSGARDSGARAEIYLRLLAEAELRRALDCPHSSMERLPPAAVRWAANAVGAVSGTADVAARSLSPAAARAGQIAGPWAATATRLLAPPARQARQAGRALAQAGWRARIAADRFGNRVTRQGQPDGPAPRDSLERLHTVAQVLVATEVLAEPVMRSVTHDLGRALAARGLVGDHYLLEDDMTPGQAPSAPAGPFLATGINAQVDLAADGYRARMHVLALVLAPDEAILSTVSWLAEAPPGHEDPDNDWAFDDPFIDLLQGRKGRATDSQGGTYRLRMTHSGPSLDGPWETDFTFSPKPPAGLDWLDITLGPGQDPIRVDLSATVAAEDGATRPLAGPAERAERIIDSVSERLLAGYDPECPGDDDPAEIAGLVRALRAAEALAPDSPALARLVTLARRLGRPGLGELDSAEASGPADLPRAWLSVLEQDRRAGPADQARAATALAVLPELDGARCVLAGLVTEAGSSTTTMQLMGWGGLWPEGIFNPLWRPFSWWARDDAGRWYLCEQVGISLQGGVTYFQVELSPPVQPDATSLEVIFTGLSGQVSATAPVTWARVP